MKSKEQIQKRLALIEEKVSEIERAMDKTTDIVPKDDLWEQHSNLLSVIYHLEWVLSDE